MEGEHPLEKDFTRHHQVLQEGDKFERSFLRLDRCFLALLRVDTHLLRALWNALRLPLVGFRGEMMVLWAPEIKFLNEIECKKKVPSNICV